MFVPWQVVDNASLQVGSKIKWLNEDDIAHLTGEVIEYIPDEKIIISLQDTSWRKVVPKGTVTYEFHLQQTDNGTRVKFYLGDLSIDPEAKAWFDAYNESDEIGAVESWVF